MITMALLTAAGACIIIGARRMLRFESYRSAIMTSLIGQPVGLWALWVLMKPEVSDCFVSQRGGETDNSEPRR